MSETGNPPAGDCGTGPYEMGDPDLTPRPIDQFLPDRSPRMAARRCAFCRHPLHRFRDALSAREAAVTGQCQCCQDTTDAAALAIERVYAAHHGFDLDPVVPPDDGPCREYDEAGPGAGLEADGFPQCAGCGYLRSEHVSSALSEISRAMHTQEAVLEPLAVALGVDDPSDIGAILDAMSERLTKASGRPVYLHTIDGLTDLARFEAAYAERRRLQDGGVD
jgi:hypothetical protein